MADKPIIRNSEPMAADLGFLAPALEVVLRKYFTVWIWSILVGVVTTTTLSLTTYNALSRGSFLTLLLTPLMLISALFTIAAWVSIYQFLIRSIIPAFFGDTRTPAAFQSDPGSDKASQLAADVSLVRTEREAQISGAILQKTVRFAILAVAFRVTLAVSDQLLSSVGYLG